MYTYEQMIKDLGEIPYCQCKDIEGNNCGLKVNIHPNQNGSYVNYQRLGYPKFIKGHNVRCSKSEEIRLKISDARKEFYFLNPEEKMTGIKNPSYKPEIHKKYTIDDFIRDIGKIPLCQCSECQKNGTRINIKLTRRCYYECKKHGYPQFITGHQNLGKIPWNKDKPWDQEIKDKISIANVGKETGEDSPRYNPNLHKSIEEIEKDLGEIPYCQCDTNNGQGCGQKVNVNPLRYEEYKEKGYPQFLPGHCSKGKNAPLLGCSHTQSTKQKMSDSWDYDKHFTEETRQKIGIAVSGENNGMYGKYDKDHPMYGKHQTLESIEKQKRGLKEYFKNNPDARRGANNPNWQNGISFDPYCPKFNDKNKEKVRIRDRNVCQLCGRIQLYTDEFHSVHHIHYDKPNCYPDLVCLCRSCNAKVNFNRKEYESFFMNKLNDRQLLFWSIRNIN